jgi:tetratricopeptide (TPR) repeat protein
MLSAPTIWLEGIRVEDRIDRAREVYERAVFGGDASGLAIAERDLSSLEADLALARGRLMHARYLQQRDRDQNDASADAEELAFFERAARLYRMLGDLRGESEALFWIGAFHQIVGHDDDAAVRHLERAGQLASEAGDMLTVSYVLRHLGIAEHAAGRLETAREHLAESTRIRRELGFLPGVAANLVGLAYIAAGQGRVEDARTLIDEASAIAEDHAHGLIRQVEAARAEFAG